MHCQHHNRVWSIGYEVQDRWYACNLFIEEECPDRHYQNNIGIPTNNSTRNAQGIEGSNHLSRTGIWIHRKPKGL